MDAATRRQVDAATPYASTWLSANAGSGKTRVLTDRVARLLLEEVQPQNILCLTYTKAAASEMQIRLFERLGKWSMMSEENLAADLQKLGVEGLSDPNRLAKARQLFARAIETPGGLRIQTIHSFCASILRRFPLEAGVPPNFTEMDDRSGALLRETLLDHIATTEPGILQAVARFHSGDDFDGLISAILGKREAFDIDRSQAEIFGWFEIPADLTPQLIAALAFDGSEPSFMPGALTTIQAGSANDQKLARALADIDWTDLTYGDVPTLADVLLTKSGAAPFTAKIGSLPTKKTAAALGPVLAKFEDLMRRIEIARDSFVRYEAAQKAFVLHQFSRRFLELYKEEKQRRGWLDFDDLILKTRTLLGDSTVANWVLFRLDGGLDHILVDEAQDTSPAQWQVIEQLAQEFTSGIGARDNVERTIFVVGDKKQSIYSFQGADPSEFDRMRDHFKQRLGDISAPFQDMSLEHSFRSSSAILRFVDQTVRISEMRHRAFHAEYPGRVDLWPVVEKVEPHPKENWFDPVDIVSDEHHDITLARKVAAFIAEQIQTGTLPLTDGTWRRIRAADFLILVRSRGNLFKQIIRECKRLELPVAGADRLQLGAELAVKDLLALLSFATTPEDDLSLAEALKSPFFGWTEAMLYDLAADRGDKFLWQALRERKDAWPDTHVVLSDLLKSADFLRPFELLNRILIRHDGRRKFTARLGREAEDGIDALLDQSLAYERNEVPSLTGFLAWLDTDNIDIKRQVDTNSDLIRVMSVHGAKGLEAPIVILPDTAKWQARAVGEVINLGGDRPAWAPAADKRPDAVTAALSAAKDKDEEERERLFYVAATRAETWLVIAAAGDVGEEGKSWYSIARTGLEGLGALPLDGGLRYQPIAWRPTDIESKSPSVSNQIEVPSWASTRPKAKPDEKATIAPTQLGGAKALPGDLGQDKDTAIRHGSMVHRLLETLPDVPQAEWVEFSKRILQEEFDEDSPNLALEEAMSNIRHPGLAHLFAPGTLSEVDISANLAALQDQRIAGTIDKLVISSDKVIAVDFKSNRQIPEGPAQVPEGILRQMAAYLFALEQIFPERPIEVQILWTASATLMPLPHEIVRDMLQNISTS